MMIRGKNPGKYNLIIRKDYYYFKFKIYKLHTKIYKYTY